MYIATENAFPDSTGRAAFSWKRLEEAVSSNQELKELKNEVFKVEKTKEMLIDYVPYPSLFSNALLIQFLDVEGSCIHEGCSGQ